MTMKMCVGVSTIRNGYGSDRGVATGRHFSCGSSCDLSWLIRLRVSGRYGSVSPFGSNCSMLTMPARRSHTPVRSGWPFGFRGVGPLGAFAVMLPPARVCGGGVDGTVICAPIDATTAAAMTTPMGKGCVRIPTSVSEQYPDLHQRLAFRWHRLRRPRSPSDHLFARGTR